MASWPSGVCALMPCSKALVRRGGWPASSGINAVKLVVVKGTCMAPRRSACWPEASILSASGKGRGVAIVSNAASQLIPSPAVSSPGVSMESCGTESRAAKGQPPRSGMSWLMRQPSARRCTTQSEKPSAKAPALQRQSKVCPATRAANKISTPKTKRPRKGARGGLGGLAIMLGADIAPEPLGWNHRSGFSAAQR